MQKQPHLTRRRVDRSRWVVRLEGEHDASSGVNLSRELEEALQPGADVIVDLSDADFIDSSILGVLVKAHQVAEVSAGVRLAVVAPPGTPAGKLFDLVGARDFIPTFPSFGDAARSSAS